MKKRDKSILVKLSVAERVEWQRQAQAAGVTVSDLIRSRMETTPVGRSPVPRRVRGRATAPAELVQQIARIGNNLNQVARQLNSGQWGPGDQVAILAYLAAIERVLGRMLDAWTPHRGEDAH